MRVFLCAAGVYLAWYLAHQQDVALDYCSALVNTMYAVPDRAYTRAAVPKANKAAAGGGSDGGPPPEAGAPARHQHEQGGAPKASSSLSVPTATTTTSSTTSSSSSSSSSSSRRGGVALFAGHGSLPPVLYGGHATCLLHDQGHLLKCMKACSARWRAGLLVNTSGAARHHGWI